MHSIIDYCSHIIRATKVQDCTHLKKKIIAVAKRIKRVNISTETNEL